MPRHELAWLLEIARHLSAQLKYPVQVRALLGSLGIRLDKRRRNAGEGGRHAELHRDPDGQYRVVVLRESALAQVLTARERFSIVHELAHVLLELRFGTRPTTRAEYYAMESWCDAFAGHLLIPDTAVQNFRTNDAPQVLRALIDLAANCKVSQEAAARRLVEQRDDIAFLRCRPKQNAEGQSVVRVDWCTSRVQHLAIGRGKHIHADNPLGAVLLHESALRSQETGEGGLGGVGAYAWHHVGPTSGTRLFAFVLS